MKEQLIKELIETKLWMVRPHREHDNPNKFTVLSHMKGYMGGRYTMEIQKLLRRVEGKRYKLALYYTPYNPRHLVKEGRFNDLKELKDIVTSVNNDLFNPDRIFMS